MTDICAVCGKEFSDRMWCTSRSTTCSNECDVEFWCAISDGDRD